MSWRMVNGKPIKIADTPTIVSYPGSGPAICWNVRDIIYKDFPECDPPKRTGNTEGKL